MVHNGSIPTISSKVIQKYMRNHQSLPFAFWLGPATFGCARLAVPHFLFSRAGNLVAMTIST